MSTLPALASLDDLETWLGAAPENEDRAQAVLVGASAVVRAFRGLTWTDEDGELTDVPDEVRTVVLLIAERVLAGSGPGVQSETIDGYTVRFRDSSSAWLLTDAEKAMLSGATNILTSVRLEAPAFPLPNWRGCDELCEYDDA